MTDKSDPLYGRVEPLPDGFDRGSLPGEDAGFWETMGQSWREQNINPEVLGRRFVAEPDPDFELTGEMMEQANVALQDIEDFDWVTNQKDFDWQAQRSRKQNERRQFVANSGRIVPSLIAGMLQPEVILTSLLVPGAVGVNASRTMGGTVVKTALLNTAAEVPFEGLRQATNPATNWNEGMLNLGTVGVLSGVVGGAIYKGISASRVGNYQSWLGVNGNQMAQQARTVTVGPISNGAPQGELLSRLVQGGYGTDFRLAAFDMPGGRFARYISPQQLDQALRDGIQRVASTGTRTGDIVQDVGHVMARAEKSGSIDELLEAATPISRELDDETKFLLQTMLGSKRPTEKLLVTNPKALHNEFSRGIDHNQRQGSLPSLTDLGVRIKDVNDLQELSLLNELARATYDTPVPVTAQGFGATEIAARTLGADSYLKNRTNLGQQHIRDFDTAIARNIDHRTRGALKKVMGGAADGVERALADSAANVIQRLSKGKTERPMKTLLATSGDGYMTTLAMRAGKANGPSVHNIKMQYIARGNAAIRELRNAWANHKGIQNPEITGIAFKAEFQKGSYDKFIGMVTRLRMKGLPVNDPNIAAAIKAADDYYNFMSVQLENTYGVMNPSLETLRWKSASIKPDLEKAIAASKADLVKRGRPANDRAAIKNLDGEGYLAYKAFKRTQEDIDDLETNGPISNVMQSYMHRTNNVDGIERHIDEYTEMVERKLVQTGVDPLKAPSQAKSIVRGILLGRDRVDAPADVGLSALRKRVNPLEDKELIDVTMRNGEVVSFIDTDLDRSIRRYSVKTGAYIGYYQNFHDKAYLTPDQNFMREVELGKQEMLAAGASKEDADLVATNLVYQRDFEMHRIMKDPDSMDAQFASWVKAAAYPAVMALSGLSQLPEFAMGAMAMGWRGSFRPIWAVMGRHVQNYKNAAWEESQLAGILNETTGGHLSHVVFDDPGLINQRVGGAKEWRDRFVDNFFFLNGVKSFTLMARQYNSIYTVDAVMRGIMATEGVNIPGIATRHAKEEARYVDLLQKMGFSTSDRKALARQLKNDWQNMYDADAKMFYGNSKTWDEGLAVRFRSRLKDRVDSLVLVAHSTDRWKILNGVVTVKDTPLMRKLTEGIFVPRSLKQSLKDFTTERDAVLTELTDPNLTGLSRTMKLEELTDLDSNIASLQSKMDLGTGHGYLQLESAVLAMPFFLMSFQQVAGRRILAAGLRREFHAPITGMAMILGLELMSQAAKKDLRDWTVEGKGNWNSWDDALWQAVWRHSAFGLALDLPDRAMSVAASLGAPDPRPKSVTFGGAKSPAEELSSGLGGVLGSMTYKATQGEWDAWAPFKQFGPFKNLYDAIQSLGDT